MFCADHLRCPVGGWPTRRDSCSCLSLEGKGRVACISLRRMLGILGASPLVHGNYWCSFQLYQFPSEFTLWLRRCLCWQGSKDKWLGNGAIIFLTSPECPSVSFQVCSTRQLTKAGLVTCLIKCISADKTKLHDMIAYVMSWTDIRVIK